MPVRSRKRTRKPRRAGQRGRGRFLLALCYVPEGLRRAEGFRAGYSMPAEQSPEGGMTGVGSRLSVACGQQMPDPRAVDSGIGMEAATDSVVPRRPS